MGWSSCNYAFSVVFCPSLGAFVSVSTYSIISSLTWTLHLGLYLLMVYLFNKFIFVCLKGILLSVAIATHVYIIVSLIWPTSRVVVLFEIMPNDLILDYICSFLLYYSINSLSWLLVICIQFSYFTSKFPLHIYQKKSYMKSFHNFMS